MADNDKIIEGKLEVPTRRKRRYEPLDYTPNREVVKSKPARGNAKKASSPKPKSTAKPKATKSPEQKDAITKTTKSKATTSNKTKVSASVSKAKSTKDDATKTKSTKSSANKTSTAKTKSTTTKSTKSSATKSSTSKTKKDTAVNAEVNLNKTDSKAKSSTKKTTSKSKAGVAVAGTVAAGAVVAGAVIANKKRQTKKETESNISEEKNLNIDINDNKSTEQGSNTDELHNESVELNDVQAEVAMAKEAPPVDSTPKSPPPPPPTNEVTPPPPPKKPTPPKKPSATPPQKPSNVPPPPPSPDVENTTKKPKKLKKDVDLEFTKLPSGEGGDAKRLEKERIKREKARAKAEAKAQKNLNQDITKPIIADESKQVDDINKSKKKSKKKWLWLLLLLLILLLVFFLVWGREIFEVPITYKVDPEGNVIEIASPDEEIPVSEFKFMPGDVISFKEPLYLVHHTRNDDGEYNNMFTFRFKAYVLYEDKVYNIIENFNDGVDAKLVKYRDYWYYQGIILPNNEPVDILNNFTVDIASTTNELSGKTVQLVLELETVYPTEEQIYEKFGGGPGGWLAFVTVMYENYASQGYR